MLPSPQSYFAFQPDISYFDHGGYSLPLLSVVQEQIMLNQRINRNPSQFFRHELISQLEQVRETLGAFLGCPAAQLSFVPNATYAFETVLRNLTLDAGDAVLINQLSFYANRKAVGALAERLHLEVIDAPISLPVQSAADLVEALKASYTPKVKLVVIDHVTSPAGIVFPVQEIAAFFKQRGCIVIIDGAQAPGQVPVDLSSLPVDFYFGNCHKWLSSLRTAAFLYTAEEWSTRMRGLITARSSDFPERRRSRLQQDTDCPGAYDPTPILCLPKALETLSCIYAGGIRQLMRENHEGLLRGLDILIRQLNLSPLVSPEMVGSMISLRLHDRFELRAEELQKKLFDAGVSALVFASGMDGEVNIRFCHQAYISPEDYQKAADVLVSLRS
ncbi:MAG: aminotransferase class V-fold PLP-dependent enzyme [Pseudobdellovibrionaceae bacterium]|nr:aminotransferase class V-fold PLP-dependent enzyme [Pseudobdellovibrionaceae bacterium]